MRISGMGNPETIAESATRVQVGTKKICPKMHIHQGLHMPEAFLNRTLVGSE
jgi:hypothetical protein